MLPEPIAVTLQVTHALEQIGVQYFVGGSFASAIYGISRATMDVDMIADLMLEHIDPFTLQLGDTFYIDDVSIREAIEHRGSFNIIHRETMFKVDIFIPKKRPFDQAQFSRRVLQSLATDPERAVYVASAEDTILAKLEWYHLGNEVSERQWGDVLGLLKVQAEALDFSYLRSTAKELNVEDLLERALKEA